MKNKANIWNSKDDWKIQKYGGDNYLIENISKKVFLRSTDDGKVIQNNNTGAWINRYWQKGVPNTEGYSTIFTYSHGLLTAASGSNLELKGNSIRWRSYYISQLCCFAIAAFYL